MSDLKISQLQELFNPYSSDVIPIVHEGITKKTPINTIVRHLSTTLDEQGLVFIGTNYQNVSGHWENTYTVVAANSAQWAIDNDDVAVNTLVRSNSAIWNTAGVYQGTDIKALTGDWQSTSNTVRSNSATNWNYQGTDLKGLSANWQSTYNTFRTVSSTFLTSETDSQTLSFDKLNNNLTISNGNTVSLSSLVDQTAIDTQTRNLTSNWQNTYNTVQSNSATTWNYQGTDIKNLSGGWVGGNSAYTTVYSKSASWDAAFGTAGADAAVRALTGSWESTYNTFQAVSSTFLTAETDSQTLSFNEGTKDLSISSGNTISLSALVDATAVDTSVRNLTSGWQSTYTAFSSQSAKNDSVYSTVQSNSAVWLEGGSASDFAVRSLTANYESAYSTVLANSATNWNYQGTDLKGLSGNWQDTFTIMQAKSAIWDESATSGYIGSDIKALTGNWESTYSTFKSVSSTFLTSETDSQTLSFDEETKDLSISNGNTISLSALIDATATDTNVRSLTSNWQNTYSTVLANSAANWNYQGTDIKNLSGGWVGGNSAYTNLVANSAAYLSSVDLSFLSVSADWNSVYNSVANISANWDSSYTTVYSKSASWDAAFGSAGADVAVRALTGNWESTYNTFKSVSSTFLTSETDSQTLSFDEGTKDLSISNGNVVSLSALVDGTAIDAGVRTLTSFWDSTYNTVQSNSAVWLEGGSASDFAVRSLTANYESAYSTVLANSATNWNYQGTDLKELSSNWESTYTTVWSKSADWDAAFGIAGADVAVRALTGSWDSTYNTVLANSATNWNYQGTDIKELSANWQSTFTAVSSNSAKWESVYSNVVANSALYATELSTNAKFLPLTGGTVTGPTQFNSNLTVYGNISATGASYFSNTFYSTTSALSVVNIGNNGPALYVGNNGTGDLASFYDLDQNIEVLHVGGSNGSFPNVGIKTSEPNKDFTVNGELSTSGDIWTSGRILSGGQELLSIITPSINSVYNTVQSNSASSWNYQGSDLKELSGNWQDTFTIMQAKSAVWDEAATSGYIGSDIKALTGNWESTYNTVQSNSASNWSYQGTDLKDLSGKWESTYNTFKAVSSTFLTSETDSQTISFDEETKDLSISNGNTVSLSALIDVTAVDTSVRNLTSEWQSTYNTVQSNSATTWNYQGTDLKDLSGGWVGGNDAFTNLVSNSATYLSSVDLSFLSVSADWNSVYSTVQSNSANYILDGGNTKGSNLLIGTNDNFNLVLETNGLSRLTILSSGDIGINETSPEGRLHVTAGSAGSVTAQTSSVGVFESSGNAYLSLLSPTTHYAGVVMGGPTNSYGSYVSWNHDNLALKLGTNHAGASIQILVGTEQEAVRVASSGNVGIGTTSPSEKLTVSGNISASGNLYGNAASLTNVFDTGIRALTGNYSSAYSTVQSNSATTWNYQGTDLKALSGKWDNTSTVVQSNSAKWVLEDFIVACSDESTNLTTSTSAVTFRVPYAMFLNSIRASVNVAPVGSTIIVDVRQNGTSIFSTKLSIDANEETSVTAATPAVISNPNLTDDAKIVVSIDQVGSTTAGRGLKLTFKGYRV